MAIIIKKGEKMAANIILYILIFIMGTVFGSFFTLAVHRIPKRQDITHTHSYCPNCGHKLGILDLIPVFSYIFLGAKCRYCKQKIRPRYFILEIASGLLFVVTSYLMNINIFNWNIHIIADSAFLALYLCFLLIMAGIDKENRQINKGINVYGIIISIMYMIYLCTIENASIYRYVIYLIFYIVFLILDTVTLKKFVKSTYLNGIMITIITIAIFTGEFITINTIIMTLLEIAIYILIYKLKSRNNKNIKTDKQIGRNLSIGYYLAINNIIYFIFVLGYYKIM